MWQDSVEEDWCIKINTTNLQQNLSLAKTGKTLN